MIDCEPMIFTPIANALRAAYDGIFVTGEYVHAPAMFPAVSIVEMDNSTMRSTQTNTGTEKHAEIMYQVDVYSNRAKGKKAECRAIAATIDALFLQYGFTKMLLQPVPNINDATIYRMTGRYRAAVSSDMTIYRR